MTNKLEQDKKIIADAPEGAMCHVSFVQPQNNTYSKKWGGESVFWDSIIKDWTRDGWGGRTSKGNFRSLDDIRENIALQERIAELELDRKYLIEEFAEAECMGDLAKTARNHGYKGGDV